MMESTGHEDVVAAFPQTLEDNRAKAELKKEEYLERIMQIFREFVSKSEQEIDRIISRKLEKLQENYLSVVDYLEREGGIAQEERSLIVTEYLVKPFEKFPFSGNKNEKIFREQYNLVEKVLVLVLRPPC
jgi:molecular chaperone GrpE (heat shock protein)